MTDGDQRMWQFGAQARPWIQTLGAPAFREALPDVMRQIAGIGFSGFETALPILPLNEPDRFAEWRAEANSLKLAAAHTGGNWWEPTKAVEIPAILEQVAHLPELGCHRLMVSIGSEAEQLGDSELERLSETLDRLGEGSARHGVEVAIHNHAHELRNDARVLRALLRITDPSHVSLGADIGWVVYAGWDLSDFVDTFGPRLSYLHVRDILERDGQLGFVEVGRGSLDWRAFTSKLHGIKFRGWLTAESEFSDVWLGFTEPEKTIRAQFEGLSNVLADSSG